MSKFKFELSEIEDKDGYWRNANETNDFLFFLNSLALPSELFEEQRDIAIAKFEGSVKDYLERLDLEMKN